MFFFSNFQLSVQLLALGAQSHSGGGFTPKPFNNGNDDTPSQQRLRQTQNPLNSPGVPFPPNELQVCLKFIYRKGHPIIR